MGKSNAVVRLLIPAIILACAVASAVPLKKPTTSKSADIEKSTKELVRVGTNALFVKNYLAASQAFDDALTLDPKNVSALRGSGAANLQLTAYEPAHDQLESAYKIAGQIDRALLENLAVCYLESPNPKIRNPMRVAKWVQELYANQSSPPDEAMFDILATAIERGEERSTTKVALFVKCKELRDKWETSLNASRQDGQKRWGRDWVPDDEYSKNKTALNEQEKLRDELTQRIAAIDDKTTKNNNELRRFFPGKDMPSWWPDHVRTLKRENESMANERKEKAPELEAAKKSIAELTPKYAVKVSPIPIFDFPKEESPTKVEAPVVADTTPVEIEKPEPPKPKEADPVRVAVLPTPPPPVAPTRHVTEYATAFAISPNLVVAPSAVLTGDIQKLGLQNLDGVVIEAQLKPLAVIDEIALLEIADGKLPFLDCGGAFVAGDILCVGYPTVSIFDAVPTAIKGSAQKPGKKWTVRLEDNPRLAGAPLIQGNRVIGVSLAERQSDPGQIPAVELSKIQKLLDAATITLPAAPPRAGIAQGAVFLLSVEK